MHGIICYSQHLEIIQISVSSRVDEYVIVPLHEVILYCNENEGTIAVINNMDEFHQANTNERREMQILNDSIYIKFEKQASKTIVLRMSV